MDDEIWNLEGAALILARELHPDATPTEWARELIYRRQELAAEFNAATVADAVGAERRFGPLEFLRIVTAREAQRRLDDAVRTGRLTLLDPVLEARTDVVEGAFVRAVDVRALTKALLGSEPVVDGAAGATKRVPAHQAQEQAILLKLKELGFDPLALPRPPAGKVSEPKSKVMDALRYSVDVMNKAWQRLRKEGAIKDAPP
ncbi:MAG: hypothetical protein JO006_03515 [Paucibacter sp.]|nr:hypothetical protein [Roseateles sp.]